MFVCEVCGTMHVEKAMCCGQETKPWEVAIGDQIQLFELSGNEKAENILRVLKMIYEGAVEKANKAAEKALAAKQAADKAGANLIDFYSLTLTTGADLDESAIEKSARKYAGEDELPPYQPIDNDDLEEID